MALSNWITNATIRGTEYTEYMRVAMISNTIGPTVTRQSATIQDKGLYLLGGVSFRENTSQSEYEATPKPNGNRHDDRPL